MFVPVPPNSERAALRAALALNDTTLSVTTSPGFRPEVICVSPEAEIPVVTGVVTSLPPTTLVTVGFPVV